MTTCLAFPSVRAQASGWSCSGVIQTEQNSWTYNGDNFARQKIKDFIAHKNHRNMSVKTAQARAPFLHSTGSIPVQHE